MLIRKHATLHLISYDLGAYQAARFQEPKNDWVKPQGGLWSSPQDAKYGWKAWCIDNDYGVLASYFKFDYTSSNIYVIDGVDDLKALPRYAKYDWAIYLDFEHIVRLGIDAIHLTEHGERTTRYLHTNAMPMMYGWDCESVLILNKDHIRVTETWHDPEKFAYLNL